MAVRIDENGTYRCAPCPQFSRREIVMDEGHPYWEVQIKEGRWTRVYHMTRMHLARDEDQSILDILDRKHIPYVLV
jgi:hypothetical protein